MSMVNVEEGMFAYGVTPKSKREGMIGWISKINYKKKLLFPIGMAVRLLGMSTTSLLHMRKRRTRRG